MTKLIILGSSNAIATENHENTHMVLVGEKRTVLVDCVSSPLLRLERAGVDFNQVSDLILTHFHPDHVSGVPLLLMDLWLLGRRAPLKIHGLEHTLERVENLMGFYGWKNWPAFFPVEFSRVAPVERTLILTSEDFRLYTSPVRHLIPTIGLRIESAASGKVIAYSCDTEPCQEVAHLAESADILIHEAAGAGRGHSSAAQAADIAREAEVGRLLLIHYPTGRHSADDIVGEARAHFQGAVALAEDFMELEMD
jgi:ribonuclease Z